MSDQKYYLQNREIILAKKRSRYQKMKSESTTYYQCHHDKILEQRRTYRKRNHDKILAQEKLNRARDCLKLKEYRKRLQSVRRKEKYGLGEAAFKQMFISQKAICAICQKRFIDRKDVQVDHCHDFNLVRSLLCSKCNRGIGCFGDSVFADTPQLLRTAADYIEKWHHDHLMMNQAKVFHDN